MKKRVMFQANSGLKFTAEKNDRTIGLPHIYGHDVEETEVERFLPTQEKIDRVRRDHKLQRTIFGFIYLDRWPWS